LQEAEIHKSSGDDGESGDGKRRAYEQRKDDAVGAGFSAQKAREEVGSEESSDEGKDAAQEADEQRASALLEDAAQTGFESGGQQKEDDPERGDGLNHDRDGAGGRK